MYLSACSQPRDLGVSLLVLWGFCAARESLQGMDEVGLSGLCLDALLPLLAVEILKVLLNKTSGSQGRTQAKGGLQYNQRSPPIGDVANGRGYAWWYRGIWENWYCPSVFYGPEAS